MSAQLEALAEEVFEAAAALNRAGAVSRRTPAGEVRTNPRFPDIDFLNGLFELRGPALTRQEVERTLRGAIPGSGLLHVTSRDPATIGGLDRQLIDAGYSREVMVGMVQLWVPEPSRSLEVVPADETERWHDLEALVRLGAAEAGWSGPITEQLVDLIRWRAGTPDSHFYLAIEGDAVGYVGLFQHRTTGYLYALYTAPRWRRAGVGGALVMAMSREARRLGCDRLALHCDRDSPLPAWYARLGFRAVGEEYGWTKVMADESEVH